MNEGRALTNREDVRRQDAERFALIVFDYIRSVDPRVELVGIDGDQDVRHIRLAFVE